MKEKEQKPQKKKITSKQIIALSGVILLLLLYLITLIAAIADNSDSAIWFRISLFATLAIPVIIWLYAWMYARLTGKRTVGAPNSPSSDAEDTSCGGQHPTP